MAAVKRLDVLLAALLAASACTGPSGQPPPGTSSGGGDPGTGGAAAPPFSAPGPTLRRLLRRHYINAVGDLLGAAALAAANPPPDSSINGFDAIAAAQLSLGEGAIAAYESSALAIATVAVGDMAAIGPYLDCTPAGPADVLCHKHFIANLGRVAWRRPLDATELDRYGLVAHQAATVYNDFYAGVKFAIAGILQSPNFVYEVEIGTPVPSSAQGLRRLTGYEVATRMAFFLTDTTPSPSLLDAAEAGHLDTADGVRAAAQALIATPAARRALAAFYDELFQLRRLATTVKDATAFPRFSPALAEAMRQETLLVIEDIVWTQNTDVRNILDADETFVNADLAKLYGMSPPAGSAFAKVSVAAGQKRGGLFGHASFLSLFSHEVLTSPTLRGKFVRETLLCQPIPAPPNDVNTTLSSDPNAKTMRDKLTQHQMNPSCAGCHVLMDDVGFGLENYDATGAFQTTENGAPVDTQTTAQGIGSFDGARALGGLLRDHPDAPACMVRNLLRASTGHLETDGEAATIEALRASFAASGYHLTDLLVELVASDAFRLVGPLSS